MKKVTALGVIAAALCLFHPLGASSPIKSPETFPSSRPSTHLANPAAENCIQQGGVSLIKKRGDGAEYGVCIFPDDRQCEEWALLRGECKKGGARVTGLNRQEQIYCALLGGTNSDTHDLCIFKDGSICETLELFNGTCQKGEKREEIMRGPFH